MDSQFAKQFANDWLEAWNNHDLDKIMAHYAGELEFKSPLIVERYNDPTGTIISASKLREYFGIGLNANPALKFELIDIAVGVDGLTLYYKNARGGRTAEYFEFDANGRVVKSYSCYST